MVKIMMDYFQISFLANQQHDSLLKISFVTPTAGKRMVKANLNEKTIQLIYNLPFKFTKDTRLAIFQFKIIYHILPTNALKDAL